MQESTPGSYEDQPPPTPPPPPPSQHSSTESQHQNQQQERLEVSSARPESLSNPASEQENYDNSASDASYTESYNSDLENEQESIAIPLPQPWNPPGPPMMNFYPPAYMPPSLQGELYRYPSYYPAVGYGMASGYGPPNSQIPRLEPSHSRQHSLQGDHGWALSERQQYGDQRPIHDSQLANYRKSEQYGTNQWPPASRSAQPIDISAHQNVNPNNDEAALLSEWDSRPQDIPSYISRAQGPLQPHQLQIQYNRSGRHRYEHRSRLLEEFPALERSHWMREMASTPERLEQLVSQFPSLIGDIHIAPDGPGQQNPNLFSRLRVNTTLWEAETTICIVVEIDQRSVSRRCDNNMINGTKLLNVARISRGRRDGILKGEKIRKVVKVGNMNNKGVWIPFERALEIAQREEILDSLYPLFVIDLNPLLFSPSNQSRLKQMLLKGAQKNPEFRKWFDGIPPLRAKSQLQQPHHKSQQQLQAQSESQAQAQAQAQAQCQSHIEQQESLPGPLSPSYTLQQTHAYLPAQAGPGPTSLSRTHRRTRSQQQQQQQPKTFFRGSSVQKQHRNRRGS